MKRLLAVLIFLISLPCFSATITAAAGGGNWSNTATWVGAATPTAADDVLLAITSGSVTVDVGTALAKSVTATAFINNLNFSAGQTLTVSGNVQFDTLVSGMTVNGTGILTINAASAFLSAGQTITGGLLNSSTITLGDNMAVSNYFANGTSNGNLVTATGSVTIQGSGLAGTSNFNMVGTGTFGGGGLLTVTGGVTFNTSGTITIANVNTNNSAVNINYTAGTIVNTGSLLKITQNVTLNTGTMHWNNILVGTAGTSCSVTLGSQLIADRAVSILGHSSAFPVTFAGAFNLTCGELDLEPNFSTIRFPAGVTITVNNTYFADGQSASKVVLQSATASSSIFLKYLGTCTGVRATWNSFTDVDASLSSIPITVIGGTLLRTTNIVSGTSNTLPSCGGSSRGYFY